MDVIMEEKLDNCLGMTLLSSDITEIAQEIEIETTPMTPKNDVINETSKISFPGELSPDTSNSYSDTSSIMKNVEYEDITDDELDQVNSTTDHFKTELVSLLTPESMLIEDDWEDGTDNKLQFLKNSCLDNNNTPLEQLPTSSAIRVSTIKWAPKIEPEVNDAPPNEIDSQPMCIGTSPEEEDDDEVVFLGEFQKPKTRAILPCFLPCCYNALAQPVINVRVWHQNRPRGTIQASGIFPDYPKLRLFPEPPESEWVTAKVFHLIPVDWMQYYNTNAKCNKCYNLNCIAFSGRKISHRRRVKKLL